jgi:molybdopterin-containing oxidoreductase family iron-sulfur binding subunit
VPPEGIVPGRTYQYASVCGGCSAGCGILAQNRDGRPIKLEGNPDDPLSHGGLCAAGQASILGLYDRYRLQRPMKNGQPTTWDEVDTAVRGELEAVRKQGKAVRLLTTTITSPTSRHLIQGFLGRFPNARHVTYDVASNSAILEAHARTHGLRVLPHYRLDVAETIVSFDADFLGTWIAPVEYAAAYKSNRRLEGPGPHLSRHIQFESRLSLTGSKADDRIAVAPGEIGSVLSHLAARLATKAGMAWRGQDLEPASVSADLLDELAETLWSTQGKSLVLCGGHDVSEQVLCNWLNHLVKNYGATLDIEHPSYQCAGSDRDLESLLKELHEGAVAALIVVGPNPVFDLPNSDSVAADLRRVPLLVSCAERMDETSSLARYVCPVPHYLETWADAETVDGIVGLSQPVIRPLGDTRAFIETLSVWSGQPRPAYDLIRASWDARIYSRRASEVPFESFWDSAVHAGYAQVRGQPRKPKPFDVATVAPVARARRPGAGEYDLVLYTKVGIPNGSHAYNPWLQELPDPISKVTWDNYACIAPAIAKDLGLADGDVVRIESSNSNGAGIELPVLVQRGQHEQVVAVALGYGSQLSKRFAGIGPQWLEAGPVLGPNGLVGTNAAGLASWENGSHRYNRGSVRLTKTGKQHRLAIAQTYPTLEVPPQLKPPVGERRPIIQQTSMAEFMKTGPNEAHKAVSAKEPSDDLWPADHTPAGHRWGMVIDLNDCTGCSACIVACQVENNIPVVGKDEVLRHREMHWLRVDRYYSEQNDKVNVVHQPMLCQHCGNAPCEVVCPVLATVHSEEGLNQQVYNRCVGTRYCANNCPYKVRRFNWFEYARDDQLHNLVLNPGVTVRSRGVMEKCTFCIQRIEQARIESRRLGRELMDGDIQTACQQSCPTKAISFGDLNHPKSRVAELVRSRRAYRVLEELNVQPAVSYLTLVRNRPEEAGREHRG